MGDFVSKIDDTHKSYQTYLVTNRHVIEEHIAATVAFAQNQDGTSACVPVGGVLMTNIGAIAGVTNLGPVFGDLQGSVAATILGQNSDGSYNIQHYWVTAAGDTIKLKVAVLSPTYILEDIGTNTCDYLFFCPNGNTAATCRAIQQEQVYDADTSTCKQYLHTHDLVVNGVCAYIGTSDSSNTAENCN